MFNNHICLFIVFPQNGATGKTATTKQRFFKKEPTENLINANNCHSYKTALLTFEW